MNNRDHKDVFNLFNDFVETLFVNGKNFLKDNCNDIIFTEENITKAYECYTKNPNTEKDKKFNEKLKEQFKNEKSDKVGQLMAHAIWLWGFSINRAKASSLVFIEEKDVCSNKCHVDNEIANAGMFYINDKYFEIELILHMFKAINEFKNKENRSKEDIINYIEEYCLCYKYKESGEKEHKELFENGDKINTDRKRPIVDILLYLSKPDKYEPIVSYSHKEKIVSFFNALIQDEEEDLNCDERIMKIRTEIESLTGNKSFDFYDKKIKSFWNVNKNEDGTDVFSALNYKKNIVFYGPPGTGKTYSAKQLAKAFIVRELIRKKEFDIRSYLEGEYNDDINRRINIRQLHANYSYDSFIVGQTIENGNITIKKGAFYELCEKASNDPKEPYVLILDELNRVDVARLFGEAFSGIENRGEGIQLPFLDDNKGSENYGSPLSFSVPKNLYIIGTMNEIDFSLERLDFALRRRFLWFKHSFDADSMRDVFSDKIYKKLTDNENKAKIVSEFKEFVDGFVSVADIVNKKISNIPELGEEYVIGHTYFAEIFDLFFSIKETSNKQKKTAYKGAKEMLWNISIRPIIEAYLDNTDPNRKKTIIKEIKEAYEQEE